MNICSITFHSGGRRVVRTPLNLGALSGTTAKLEAARHVASQGHTAVPQPQELCTGMGNPKSPATAARVCAAPARGTSASYGGTLNNN